MSPRQNPDRAEIAKWLCQATGSTELGHFAGQGHRDSHSRRRYNPPDSSRLSIAADFFLAGLVERHDPSGGRPFTGSGRGKIINRRTKNQIP